MLNELLLVKRGAPGGALEEAVRHKDIKDAGRKPTLRVRLNAEGNVALVDPVPTEARLWTLGKGLKKRFPFLQPNAAFLRIDEAASAELQEAQKQKNLATRREALLRLCDRLPFNEEDLNGWPGVRDKRGSWSQDPEDYLKHLRTRRKELQALADTPGKSVLAVLDRFVKACGEGGKDGINLLRQITERLVRVLHESPDEDWLRVAEPLLLKGGGALFFDVPSDEFERSVADPRQVGELSKALTGADSKGDSLGVCFLTGDKAPLVDDTFPDPVLPVIGKTILFSRFDAIPSNTRYGRTGAQSFYVSRTEADALAATLRYLTMEERKNICWRSLPGEAPKTADLLLAYVDGVPDAPVAESLADDMDEDFEEETDEQQPRVESAGSIAAFEKRTQRVIELVKAKRPSDLSQTVVRVLVIRKLDPSNRKIVYARAMTVSDLYEAALDWTKGERNLPSWLSMPVLHKGESEPRPVSPPHIAPLGLVSFSKQTYRRGGRKDKSKDSSSVVRYEVTGISASEALALFLQSATRTDGAEARAKRILRLVLQRRGTFAAEAGHALRKGMEYAKAYDRKEALRTATIIGVLLHKLGREEYMDDTAFKLGQLLAAVDIVHAGYCADMRGGDVPPSLLGNQVYPMALTTPVKALAMLSRRWKPYAGWARKNFDFQMPARFLEESGRWKDRRRIQEKKDREEYDKAAAIIRAVSHSRRFEPLAVELAGRLPSRCDDAFRAELLLGYMAGLPKFSPQESSNGSGTDTTQGREEE